MSERLRGRKVAVAGAVVLAMLAVPATSEAVTGTPSAVQMGGTTLAQPAPGGKTNFVVSVGGFRAGRTDNWLRISQYTFQPASGTISARWWRWNQGSRRDIRVDTPVAAAGCGPTQCYARTPKRFLSAPSESASGTYQVSGATLTIFWPNGATPMQEKWTIAAVPRAGGSVDPTLVQLVWAGAAGGFNATAGYGFGSNAGFAASVGMSDLMRPENRVAYRYRYSGIAGGRLNSGTSSLNLPIFQQCRDARCLGAAARTAAGQGCVYYPPGESAGSTTINYYLASFAGDRRNAYEHWFRCLSYHPTTGQQCYKLNSHVKPLLQVLDDNGRFRGWVGAETSFHTTGNGNSAGDPINDTLSVVQAGPRLLDE